MKTDAPGYCFAGGEPSRRAPTLLGGVRGVAVYAACFLAPCWHTFPAAMEVDQAVMLDEDEEQPAEGEFIARYKLTVEYVGPRYHGSQRQGNKGKTVQEELEVALGKLTHAPPPSTVFSGRTDAGVHAVGQVVHADLCRRSRRGQPLPPMEVAPRATDEGTAWMED